jgi:hypothetical protein
MLIAIRILIVVGLLMITAGPVSAKVFSESAKLGANTGAMKYCADNFANGNEKKYKLLRLKTLKEYDGLESDEKAKALILRKAAEDKGEYLGDKLDKKRCDSIRKILQLKY